MLSSNISLENFLINSKQFKKNLLIAQRVFKSFKHDLKNYDIPLFQSFNKDYDFDFTKETVKKFSKYQNIIIIGIGGSILGAKCIYSFFKNRVKKKIFFFDNLDSNLHLNFNQLKNLKNSCYIIVSKSGNTLETIANLGGIFSKSIPKNKLIFITEIKESCLMSIAGKNAIEIIEHKNFIGGRYSVLSEVGMFPAALMGLNINKFKNFEKFINSKKIVSSLIKNIACIYTLYGNGVKNSVLLNYNNRLDDFGYWYQQLVGESLGKKGKGITPILSKAPRDHHSVLQLYLDGPKDKFFTFFSSSNKKNNYKVSKNIIPENMSFLKNKKIDSIVGAQCNATKKTFKIKNIPFRSFVFNKNDEEELGMFFIFFILETVLLARMLGVNPFDQPEVEKIKIETKKILSK